MPQYTVFKDEDLVVGNYFAINTIKYEFEKEPTMELYIARYLGIDAFELEDPDTTNIVKYKIKWNPRYEYLVTQIYDTHKKLDKSNTKPMWLYIDSYRFKYGLDYYIRFEITSATLMTKELEPLNKKRKIK